MSKALTVASLDAALKEHRAFSDILKDPYPPPLTAEELAARPPLVYEPPPRWQRFRWWLGMSRPVRFVRRLLRKAGGCTCCSED